MSLSLSLTFVQNYQENPEAVLVDPDPDQLFAPDALPIFFRGRRCDAERSSLSAASSWCGHPGSVLASVIQLAGNNAGLAPVRRAAATHVQKN